MSARADASFRLQRRTEIAAGVRRIEMLQPAAVVDQAIVITVDALSLRSLRKTIRRLSARLITGSKSSGTSPQLETLARVDLHHLVCVLAGSVQARRLGRLACEQRREAFFA